MLSEKNENSNPLRVQAVLRNIQMSPQKINNVLRSVRKQPVHKVLSALYFSKNKISQPLRKLVLSAVANAENLHGVSADSLVIAEAFCGKSFSMRRFVPRARGRSSVIRKPFSHVTVILTAV